MLTEILIVIAILIVVFAVVVSLRPGEFKVTRSATIPAPPEAVFPHVNDLHNWDAWSPWAKLDPAMQSTFDGPAAGNGASMAWSGNNKVGQGRMTITESRPHEFVQFRLEFFRPFKATNTAEFGFKAQGGQTVVSWTMLGRNNFMAKAMQLFINCDKMVGSQFEQGLAQLSSVSSTPVHK